MDKNTRELLLDIKQHMQETAEMVDGEWGLCRSWRELLKNKENDNPFHGKELYERVLAALKDEA